MNTDLKNFRLAHRLTQREMGDVLGVSKTLIALMESNRREMSVRIMGKLASARTEILGISSNSTGNDPGLLHRVTEQHLKKSITYLISYKKDCEGQLHIMQKLVESWKKKYYEACSLMFTSEIIMVDVKNGAIDPDKINISSSITNRAAAETIIRSIMDEQPEIKMIQMDGLREQLRRIKEMLSKKRKQLKLKQFGSQELPGIEPSEEKIMDVEKMVAVAHGHTAAKQIDNGPAIKELET